MCTSVRRTHLDPFERRLDFLDGSNGTFDDVSLKEDADEAAGEDGHMADDVGEQDGLVVRLPQERGQVIGYGETSEDGHNESHNRGVRQSRAVQLKIQMALEREQTKRAGQLEDGVLLEGLRRMSGHLGDIWSANENWIIPLGDWLTADRVVKYFCLTFI